MVDRFQRDGPARRVLVLSLKAGGTGLNLTAANHVVHVDRWWNPAVEDQATDRAFRIGQRRNVQVHKFVCVGTIEERIDRMIAEKRTWPRSRSAAARAGSPSCPPTTCSTWSRWRRRPSVAERRWSAEFIGMLESLRMATQFQQGRRYARAGTSGISPSPPVSPAP